VVYRCLQCKATQAELPGMKGKGCCHCKAPIAWLKEIGREAL
jgi:hypothetical protein